MRKKLDVEEEKKRVMAMYEIEHLCRKKGYKYIAGVDEAGRGPLAGPVCAAAVVLPDDIFIPGINDSKKLSEKKREELFDIICEKAIAYSIEYSDTEQIERENILAATMDAMNRAINNLSVPVDYALIDGNRKSGIECECETVVKGDSKSISIAAASILAKVSRDRFIINASKEYPEYGFERNKGYGTAEHIAALEKYGMSPIHRKKFVTTALETARRKRNNE